MLWIALVSLALVCACAGLALAFALVTAAKRADEAAQGELELIGLATRLTSLSEVRSPSGRRFYPTARARRELAEQVYEVLETSAA